MPRAPEVAAAQWAPAVGREPASDLPPTYYGAMGSRDDVRDAQRRGEELSARAFDLLTLPDALTVTGVITHVAGLRRRPITVTELPALAGTKTCGWWNERQDRDEILIAPPLSASHRDAVVLHEVGHLVLDHFDRQRSHFDDSTEIAAELLADALSRAIRRGPERLSRFLGVFG
ncbi:MAG: hypothetical protein JWP75_3626 [Frondihabitans sp.]|nr:hypothetical protein [Frondihabitans sp.]